MTMHSDYQNHDVSREAWPQTLLMIASLAAVAIIALWVLNS